VQIDKAMSCASYASCVIRVCQGVEIRARRTRIAVEIVNNIVA